MDNLEIKIRESQMDTLTPTHLTLLLLAYNILLSGLWSVIYFTFSWNKFFNFSKFPKFTSPSISIPFKFPFKHFPTLFLAPLLIAFVFRIFHIHLLMPSLSSLTPIQLMLFMIPPAGILFLSSGLFMCIPAHMECSLNRWKQSTFILKAKSFGLAPWKEIFPITIFTGFIHSWLDALPRWMSEMILIEVLFNIYGLGLGAWQHGKERAILPLFMDLLTLSGIYLCVLYVCQIGSRWIGKRLNTYL